VNPAACALLAALAKTRDEFPDVPADALGSDWRPLLVVGGVALGVGLLVFCLVVLGKARRRKRRLRAHRQRNPTLAETGGLPPRRDPADAPPPR